MSRRPANPIVHLELHTGDERGASEFYSQACGWRAELITSGDKSYLALGTGGEVGGGIVECSTERPLWLPYVEVQKIDGAIERARELGARVLLAPREGPAGWRGVVAVPNGGELAFWQPKR